MLVGIPPELENHANRVAERVRHGRRALPRPVPVGAAIDHGPRPAADPPLARKGLRQATHNHPAVHDRQAAHHRPAVLPNHPSTHARPAVDL
ncbi:hypothetical protein ACFFQW_34720 [Umezawaea endophytica]|uniref:Uncharacterized protein n=1 Tax=Umezawaea endophytica TaxID=1654476 RepID=A0A9X2VT69_9PSEU|nr:hypothetical protein [Umezawaea endophytica]MCS7481887.1 hypothetical protein [Umezawaea endophytica]